MYAIRSYYDPDMNLASSLGIENPPKPLTDFKDLIQERAGAEGGAFIYNPKVDDIAGKYGVIGPRITSYNVCYTKLLRSDRRAGPL